MFEDEIEAGQLWRHKKRGTLYEIITANAGLQCSAAPNFEEMFEDDGFVVYRSIKAGSYHIRPAPEFVDGRFERVG